MNLPAEQIVNRPPQGFSGDIQHRHLERGGRAVDDRRVHELIAQDVVPQLLGRKRRAADGVARGELLDRGFDRFRLIFERTFADAADAFVGLDVREDEIAPARTDHIGRDLGDAAGAVIEISHQSLSSPPDTFNRSAVM